MNLWLGRHVRNADNILINRDFNIDAGTAVTCTFQALGARRRVRTTPVRNGRDRQGTMTLPGILDSDTSTLADTVHRRLKDSRQNDRDVHRQAQELPERR